MEKNKQIDIVIIGAGIVGLSCAYEYLNKYPTHKLLILEKEATIFQHQSGRNSGVIHSGIYYQPDSLKAKNCINGYSKLLEFVKKYNIPFELTGKLIVTNDLNKLENLALLKINGEKNGLKGLKLLSPKEILNYEPYCTKAVGGLYVPQTGIVNYKLVGKTLLSEIQNKEGDICYNSSVIRIQNQTPEVSITLSNKRVLNCKKVIVATGINSDVLISSKLKNKYRIFPFKGEYYKLKQNKQKLVKGLIYPLPDLNFPFLGVHLTKTITNQVEAGPNAILSLSRMKYSKLAFTFNDFYKIITWKGFWIFALKYWKIGIFELIRSYSKNTFLKSLQTLVPYIKKEDLQKASAGIRAQILTKEGKLHDDFIIEKDKNITYIVNAPSPAATSSLAIAESIIKKI